ncbi:hypothetical protein RRG08_050317 [Elysia crispata]|uniref:Uncharacterized protein n=1 Tax=Elysia crispata TaxID=231223 RepID=A0AAE1DPB7_9GAST|nr:hypothetical protein RRG08_050317 [Elysia crispata]
MCGPTDKVQSYLLLVTKPAADVWRNSLIAASCPGAENRNPIGELNGTRFRIVLVLFDPVTTSRHPETIWWRSRPRVDEVHNQLIDTLTQ